MADRVDTLIQRSRLGDVGLSDAEKLELRNALTGLAPSSAKYKQIKAALDGSTGGPVYSEYRSPGQKEDGTWLKNGESETPLFSGAPTLDFLNLDHKQMYDLPEDTATAADAMPEDFDWESALDAGIPTVGDSADQRLATAFGAAMPTSGSFDTGDFAEYDTTGAFMGRPQGYATSDIALGQLGELRNDPRVMANLLAEERGGAAGTAAMYLPFLDAASNLSAQGVLGGSVNESVMGGPTSQAQNLANMEDVIKVMDQPGYQQFDPQALYQASFQRANNTEWSGMMDQGQPLTNDDIIEVTNKALLGSSAFMTEESAAYLSARLQQAAVQYKTMVATGKFSGTYPAYLDSIGAGDWIGE